MERIPQIVEELKNTTVAQVVRQIVVMVSVLMPIWLFAGTWIKAYADEAFTNMMTRQGVSPEAFGGIVRKVDEIDKRTDGIKDDLNVVKGQNKELQSQGEDLKKRNIELDKKADDLVKKNEDIAKKAEVLKNSVDEVKAQNRELQGQGEDLKAKQEDTKKLVEKLLDLQLRRNRNGQSNGDTPR